MRRLFIVTFLLCVPSFAYAQQRPLVTQDPETIGSGNVLVEGGFDYQHDIDYPVSGLHGNLWRAPLIGTSVGISSIAEFQIQGGLHNALDITQRNPNAPLASMLTVPPTETKTSDVEDFVFATKIRVAPETSHRPSFGVRFYTKLPNANNETGLGLDTTDVFGSILIGKTIQSVRVVGNIGVGILGVATRGDLQNDVTTYGLSFARALTQHTEVVGEINGRLDTRNGPPPPGTESRGLARFGARYGMGSWRVDGSIIFGLTSFDPSIGFGAGFTYVFHAFDLH